jgi:hypothetical protein
VPDFIIQFGPVVLVFGLMFMLWWLNGVNHDFENW